MKSSLGVSVASALVVGLCVSLVQPASAQTQQTINGFLFSKLDAMCSKSERPAYFLQTRDDGEVRVFKRSATEYQDDSILRNLLGKKVTITGSMDGDSFKYTAIEACPASVKCCEIQY